ncbi:MAG TPA: hypothetical protein VG164_00990 [Trebonia sp.]|jgi:hypothetical protein|nr:hypothetical protein [Trebonia sp.]
MTPPPEPPSGRLYVGWQYAMLHADPGPPPRRPVPPRRDDMSAAWLAAQRREENLLDRPLKRAGLITAVVAAAMIAVLAGGWVPAFIAAPLLAASVAAGGLSGYAIWRGERALAQRIAAERRRVERFRADQESRLFATQEEHARQVKDWQARRYAFESQKRWYAVPLPAGVDRVDVAGGTLAGWSALVTMAGAYGLAAGGELTVLDLSGGAVAADLIAVASGTGVEPAVWVLPKDLPRLDLTASLDAEALADVLALAAGADEERGAGRDLAVDVSILERVLAVLGDDIHMGRVAAALRVLAEVGDPRADLASGLLTVRETSELSTLFGKGAADRVVLERALALEAQLRKLAAAASGLVRLPRRRLRVIALNKRLGSANAKVLGNFVVTALTHVLSSAPPAAQPWRHTLFVLGAERLRDDVLDRLTDMCETSRTGLVLAYRSLPPRVRQRIGRGNAAVAFMRLGNAEDAKAASEQIGTEHRFVLSQLTETVGTSVTDTTGASYTSTVGGSASLGTSKSVSDSVSRGTSHGRSAESSFLPFAGSSTSRGADSSTSAGTSDTASVTAGISASTAWGLSTSEATSGSESLARSVQRSREFLVEASELQRLPPTAMIISYATAAGRQVFMADANPAIGSLDAATIMPLAEAARLRATGPAETLEPNLGPPAARLDWRRR